MKRRLFSALLCLTLVLSTFLAGCAGAGGTPSASTPADQNEPIKLTLLTQSNTEKIANVVRDQLTKAGFEVALNTQADASGYKEQKANGSYDIDIGSWMTVTGNPDYSVRGILITDGDNNINKISDTKVDELIEKAASQTADEYVSTYSELEKYVVDEKAYMTPLYTILTVKGINKNLIDPSTVTFTYYWEDLNYNNPADLDTVPLYVTQVGTSFTTWDPIRANDNSVGTIDCNLYIRLVNTTQDFEITTDNSLSRNYAIADGNEEFYFLLRDDTFFTRVNADKTIQETDVMVSAEDVVYSVQRMMDPDSTPLHKTYSLHESIANVEIVTDLAELEGKIESGTGDNLKAALEEGLAAPIGTLAASRDDVDNAAGAYQVVKVTTSRPFPQVLNYLSHHSGGIVDSEWVENLNKDVDVAAYDASKDVLYGDSQATIDGPNYNNTLSCSGPYVLTYMNDYEIVCVKNPGYLKEEGGAFIGTIITKPMSDTDAILSALRSNDIQFTPTVPDSKFDIVQGDENLELLVTGGARVYYLGYNVNGTSPCADENVRKAIGASINPQEILAAFNNNVELPYSTLSAVLKTDNTFTYEAGRAQTFLDAYYASK